MRTAKAYAMRWYLPNRHPVLWQELRRRLRGPRLPRALAVYLATLIAASGFALWSTATLPDISPSTWAALGNDWWQVFALAQLALSLLLSPAMTADTICRERETGTIEGLFLSRLGSDEIARGYLLGRLAGWVYLLCAAAPVLAAMGAVLGGFGPWDVLIALVASLLASLLGAGLGLLASARARRTFLAYPLAYGYLVLALVPIVLAFVVVGLLTGDFDRGDVRPWTVLLEWAGGWFLPAVGAVGLFAVWRCLVAAADEVDGDRRRPFSHLAWLQRERTKTGERA